MSSYGKNLKVVWQQNNKFYKVSIVINTFRQINQYSVFQSRELLAAAVFLAPETRAAAESEYGATILSTAAGEMEIEKQQTL